MVQTFIKCNKMVFYIGLNIESEYFVSYML